MNLSSPLKVFHLAFFTVSAPFTLPLLDSNHRPRAIRQITIANPDPTTRHQKASCCRYTFWRSDFRKCKNFSASDLSCATDGRLRKTFTSETAQPMLNSPKLFAVIPAGFVSVLNGVHQHYTCVLVDAVYMVFRTDWGVRHWWDVYRWCWS